MKIRTLLFPLIEVSKALFRPLSARQDESFAKTFIPLLLVVAVVWWVTVPVHELMHVAGCLSCGGTVEKLTVQAVYGGGLLEKLFPFVESGGDYAGRLAGFDTRGSDVCYFVTSFFPYLLTLFFGVPMLTLAFRFRSAVLHGIGFVHAVLPVVGLTGDFYEMGSIVVTRLMGLGPGSSGAQVVRGDDFFLILTRYGDSASSAGLPSFPFPVLGALGLGVVFCFLLLDLSLLLGLVFRGRKPLEKSARPV